MNNAHHQRRQDCKNMVVIPSQLFIKARRYSLPGQIQPSYSELSQQDSELHEPLTCSESVLPYAYSPKFTFTVPTCTQDTFKYISHFGSSGSPTTSAEMVERPTFPMTKYFDTVPSCESLQQRDNPKSCARRTAKRSLSRSPSPRRALASNSRARRSSWTISSDPDSATSGHACIIPQPVANHGHCARTQIHEEDPSRPQRPPSYPAPRSFEPATPHSSGGRASHAAPRHRPPASEREAARFGALPARGEIEEYSLGPGCPWAPA